MLSGNFRRSVALRIDQKVAYGWVILAVAGLGIFATGPAQSHTFGVFKALIAEDLGLTATSVSSAYGLATLVAAFGLPYMGRLVDRLGVRRTTLGVTVGLGVACILFGMVPGGLWLAFGFAGLRFLGQGSLMLNCANLVSQWFGRKRGFAMSLMALGFSLSMALHPPLAQWLINEVGWREAWLWLGVMTWLLLLPPVLLLVHDKPEQLGLLPDGDRTPPPAGRRSQSADFGLTLGEALRTPTFYIVAAGSFSLSMLVTMLHFFQVSIFESKGLSAQLGANVFALSALSMVCAMPVLGRMLDRFPTERMFAAGLVVMAGSLLAAANVHDLASSLIYGVVFGVNNAVTMTFFGFVWPRYFGRRHLGSIQGTGQMIGVVGASLGPLPLGLAEDLTGGYGTTLLALTALPLALAVLALFLREPRQMREA